MGGLRFEFPLVQRELGFAARRKRTYALRLLPACAVLYWIVMAAVLLRMLPGELGRVFAMLLSGSLEYVQFAAVFLIAPYVACERMIQEKRDNTLDLLTLTGKGHYDVLLARAVSALCEAGFIVLAALPLVALTAHFGLLTPAMFPEHLLFLFAWGLAAAAAGLLAGLVFDSFRGALGALAVVGLLAYALSHAEMRLWGEVTALNPLWAIRRIRNPESGFMAWWPGLLVPLVVAAGLFYGARHGLQAPPGAAAWDRFREAIPLLRRRAGAKVSLRKRQVPDQTVLVALLDSLSRPARPMPRAIAVVGALAWAAAAVVFTCAGPFVTVFAVGLAAAATIRQVRASHVLDDLGTLPIDDRTLCTAILRTVYRRCAFYLPAIVALDAMQMWWMGIGMFDLGGWPMPPSLPALAPYLACALAVGPAQFYFVTACSARLAVRSASWTAALRAAILFFGLLLASLLGFALVGAIIDVNQGSVYLGLLAAIFEVLLFAAAGIGFDASFRSMAIVRDGPG